MARKGGNRAGYTLAVLAALRMGPKSETELARVVLRAVGSDRCIALRRHYARLAWVSTGHSRKSWKPKGVTPKQEAILGASEYSRQALRGPIGRGQVGKQVTSDGERIYSLVATRGMAGKEKEG